MTKFHINKHGMPAPCRAQKDKCPLGGDEQHYNSKKEAEDAISKIHEEKYELMPPISNKTENKKLTPAQEKAKIKKAKEEKLTKLLNSYWVKRDGSPDEGMVKECLKSSKYIEIGDSFVDVTDAKPEIHNKMWYDDETEGPQVNFENFYKYNARMNMPKKLTLSGRNRHGLGTLKMVPQYHGLEDLKLTSLTYDDPENINTQYREVTESELEEINRGIEEVQKDYEKRLKTYFKRYEDKIITKGYWKNK